MSTGAIVEEIARVGDRLCYRPHVHQHPEAMENKMETTIMGYMGIIVIMENKVETTIINI